MAVKLHRGTVQDMKWIDRWGSEISKMWVMLTPYKLVTCCCYTCAI